MLVTGIRHREVGDKVIVDCIVRQQGNLPGAVIVDVDRKAGTC